MNKERVLVVDDEQLNLFIIEQLPVVPLADYRALKIGEKTAEVIAREIVLELTYTATDLQSWARDLDYDGAPFAFDPVRRARLRAELDAYYARLYGLTKDELRYILDPESAMGSSYPSETFRVLKEKEEREFGRFRTAEWVLDAWDRLEAGTLN